jgi:hypothetical protein
MKVERMLTSMTWSKSSSLCSATGVRRMVPPLLIRMSTLRPERSSASSVTWSRTEKSAQIGVNLRPRASTALRAALAPSGMS